MKIYKTYLMKKESDITIISDSKTTISKSQLIMIEGDKNHILKNKLDDLFEGDFEIFK